MKKVVLWLLVLSALLSFVSCGAKTIEEAYANAKHKVETLNAVDWEVESGEFQRKASVSGEWKYVYEINFYAKIDYSSKYEKSQAASTAAACYRIILKEFGNFDVDLNLVFYAKSGSYIRTVKIIDGEMQL